MKRNSLYSVILMICTLASPGYTQITGLQVVLENNIDGYSNSAISSSQYLTNYRLSLHGIVINGNLLSFNAKSDYLARTDDGTLQNIIFSKTPSRIGFYDVNLSALRNSRTPIRLRLASFSNRNYSMPQSFEPVSQHSNTSMRQLSGKTAQNTFLPAVNYSAQSTVTRKGTAINSKVNNYHYSISNSSDDHMSQYSLSYSENRTNYIEDDTTSSSRNLSLSSTIQANERVNASTTIDLSQSNRNTSIFGTTRLEYDVAPGKQFRSSFNYSNIGNGSSAYSQTLFKFNNNYRFMFRSGEYIQIFAKGMNREKTIGGIKESGLDGAIGANMNYSLNISKTKLRGRINHQQSIDLNNGIDINNYFTSSSVLMRKRFRRNTRLIFSYDISHRYWRNISNQLMHSFSYGFTTILGSKTNFDLLLRNLFYQDLTNSSIGDRSFSVDSRLVFRIGRIPLQVQNQVEVKNSDKHVLTVNTKLLLRQFKIGRNVRFSITADQKNRKTLSEIVNIEGQFSEDREQVNNYISVTGSYRFFAYNINGRVHYSLDDSGLSNRYSITIRRIVSFAL